MRLLLATTDSEADDEESSPLILLATELTLESSNLAPRNELPAVADAFAVTTCTVEGCAIWTSQPQHYR